MWSGFSRILSALARRPCYKYLACLLAQRILRDLFVLPFCSRLLLIFFAHSPRQSFTLSSTALPKSKRSITLQAKSNKEQFRTAAAKNNDLPPTARTKCRKLQQGTHTDGTSCGLMQAFMHVRVQDKPSEQPRPWRSMLTRHADNLPPFPSKALVLSPSWYLAI
jgi:hypothetical protein